MNLYKRKTKILLFYLCVEAERSFQAFFFFIIIIHITRMHTNMLSTTMQLEAKFFVNDVQECWGNNSLFFGFVCCSSSHHCLSTLLIKAAAADASL